MDQKATGQSTEQDTNVEVSFVDLLVEAYRTEYKTKFGVETVGPNVEVLRTTLASKLDDYGREIVRMYVNKSKEVDELQDQLDDVMNENLKLAVAIRPFYDECKMWDVDSYTSDTAMFSINVDGNKRLSEMTMGDAHTLIAVIEEGGAL